MKFSNTSRKLSRFSKPFSRYWLNVLLGLDQLANTLAGGDPDETVSSRLGRLQAKHNGRIPWTRPLARCLSIALDLTHLGHCRDAREPGHGGKGIADKPPRRGGT